MAGYDRLKLLPSGKDGGVVHVASMVVDGKLDEVIYLLDPMDPTSLYPEALALKRECIHKKIPFFSTVASARVWMLLHWAHMAPSASLMPGPPRPDAVAASSFQPGPGWFSRGAALVAHPAKKLEMMEFCTTHYEIMSAFAQRISTGTTGRLLNGVLEVDDPVLKSKESKQLKAAASVLRDLHSRNGIEQWTKPYQSGPQGGDVQIARDVIANSCSTVVFLEDPHRAHEHDADIRLLERACRLRSNTVICVHDVKTAERFATAASEVRAQYGDLPDSIHSAFLSRFGVRLICVRDVASEPETWSRVLDVGADFVLDLLYRSVMSGVKGDVKTVAINWGRVMHEIGERLARSLARLSAAKQWAEQTCGVPCPEIGYGEQFGLALRFIPMAGSMGLHDQTAEAAFNAARWAKHIDNADSDGWSLNLFVEQLPISNAEEVNRWTGVDFAVYTCAPMRPGFGERTTAVPDKVYEWIKGAACEASGLALNESGHLIDPFHTGYVRNGMSLAQLQRVAHAGGAVLIAGNDRQRLLPVLSLMRARAVSYLVTHRSFALECLQVSNAGHALHESSPHATH